MGENLRSGRPKTVSNANCIIKIIKLFKKRKNLLFSGIVIADITWVHYFQPQSNIQFDNNKIWITKDRKRPVIAKRCQSTKKILYAIFFDKKDVVLQFPIPKKKNVSGNMYKCKNFV